MIHKRVIRLVIYLSSSLMVLYSGCSQTGQNKPSSSGGSGHGGSSTSTGGMKSTDGGSGGVASEGGKSAAGGVTGGGGIGRGGAGGTIASGGSRAIGGATAGMSGGGSSGQGMGGAGGAGGGTGITDAAISPDAPPYITPLPRAVYNGLRGEEFDSGWKFNLGDASGAEKTTFDDSKWKALDVPHDWSIELPFNSSSASGSGGGYLDGGIGWYRKTFTLDAASAGQRIFIAFDGVYMNSQVWINGQSLGTRPYGYSTFEYEVTQYVKTDGTGNVVAVKVNNNQPNSRWYSGSGIYRNVWLTTLNPVHVPNSGVFVIPTVSGGLGSVSVSTDVQNQGAAAASVTVTTTITDASGADVASSESTATNVAAAATATVQQNLTVASPKLWSVDSPYLYRATVEVKVGGSAVDRYVTSLGFRTPDFNASSGFSLNGQRMKLQGMCMHHDLGALGAAVNYRAIERQVEILKGMGVNAIRTSHNPPAPELLDIANRLGVMIMEEAFDTWASTKTANDYGNYFTKWAQQDIQDMVRRDRNNPSVIMWSIGNEVSGSTEDTARSLKNWVLAIDKTRPVTWASNKMGGPHVSEGNDTAVADKVLDLVGYNYAPYTGEYDTAHSDHPSWKIFGSETNSALSSRGIYHTPAGTNTHSNNGTSDKQCSSYDNEAARYGLTAQETYAYDHSKPYTLGTFAWTGFDYIGEPTPNGWPAKSSYSGIVDTAGFPKDSYYFQQSRWTSAPMVHLLPHWNWTSGTTVTVYAYSNCDSVELFLNDKSQGSTSLSGSALHFEWSVPWASGTLRADCTKDGTVATTDTVKTAGAAAKIVLSADRTPIRADGKDLVFVTADVQDASGVFVPNANTSITFSVSGPGQLVGVDNGDPTDTTSYKGTSRKAFSGKALAIVRSTSTAGSIVIKASATGLTSDPLTVAAQEAR